MLNCEHNIESSTPLLVAIWAFLMNCTERKLEVNAGLEIGEMLPDTGFNCLILGVLRNSKIID